MLEETTRLTHLVASLLFLARADQNKLVLDFLPADAGEIVHSVVDTLGVLAEEKRQQITLAATGPVPIQADASLLGQALLNLLDNAIKYSPPGGAIRISVARQGTEVVMEVTDSGPGIAPEHQPHIFDRFYRVDKSRSREQGGVGLGLAITHWIVLAHHGRIELETQTGQGCTFRIILPAG